MNKKIVVGVVVLFVLIAFGVGYSLSKNNKDTPSNTSAPSNSMNVNGKSVDISGQQLTALPASVISQTDIVSLNASNNQLTALPASIGNLVNLEVLNMENNRLVSLTSEIGKLTKLKSADFSNNRLESLPPELGTLTNLESLNLDGYKGPRSDIDQLKQQLAHTNIKY